MKKRKTLTILLIVMVLAAIMVPTMALADTHTGEITISSNNVPTIDTFTVSCGSAMSPTSTYDVSITVTDLDGISNLNDIMLVFWYTTVAGDATDEPVFTQGDNDSKVLNWVEVWDGTSFTADTTNTTWAATAPSLPAGGNSHTFTFTVTVGKEAQEVSPAADADKWQIGLRIEDDNANTAYQLVSAATPISNAWYGEMTASAGAGPYWSLGSAGMAYADEPAQVFDATYTLNIISNGDYSLETYADTTWSNAGVTNSILYDTLIDAAEEFSISVDTAATYSGVTAQELQNGGATTVPLTIAIPVGWGTGTDYSGVGITNVYMFLQTNASMTNDVYTGQVTFTVVNN